MQKIGFHFNIAAILLGFGSYIVFSFGIYTAYQFFIRFAA